MGKLSSNTIAESLSRELHDQLRRILPFRSRTLHSMDLMYFSGWFNWPVAIRLYGEREFYNLAGAAFVSDPLPPTPPLLGYVVSRNSARRCAVSVGFSRLTK